MRIASLFLGLIGGLLALLLAVFAVAGGMTVLRVKGLALTRLDETLNEASLDWDDLSFSLSSVNGAVSVDADDQDADVNDMLYTAADQGLGFTQVLLWVVAALSLIGGIFGIVGGSLALKRNRPAGILMLIGCVPALFTGLGLIVSIMLLLGGIFALVPVKPKNNRLKDAVQTEKGAGA